MTPYYDNGIVQLYHSDARGIPLPDQSVHCVVTSPPYYGLRVYSGLDDQGIGLEASVEAYVANLVDVFREVRRVLRDDGVLWLNLGDSMGAQNRGGGPRTASEKQLSNAGSQPFMGRNNESDGNRLGIPERVVLALQDDGWTWRDTVIWAKKSAMPESVNGWRWEQCRVKVSPAGRSNSQGQMAGVVAWEGANGRNPDSSRDPELQAQYTDCPGCPKCVDNDGLVLRKGSWRCTSSHEYIFMLTKGMGYYCDAEAVKTAVQASSLARQAYPFIADGGKFNDGHGTGITAGMKDFSSGANRRSVWNDISPEPYGGAHFATFPSDLPRICIQASTSERGCCPECGNQYARVVEKLTLNRVAPTDSANLDRNDSGMACNADRETATLGWRATCTCGAGNPVPALVLDPFAGTFTTGLAAQWLGRRAVGVDLSEAYLQQAVKRLEGVPLPMQL